MRSLKSLGMVILTLASIGFYAGCVRTLNTAPSAVTVVTPTPTGTVTPVMTNTFTSTNTLVATSTFTLTKSNTPVFTNTFTNTYTKTFTPIPTNTFTPTNTGANTATFTFTGSPTNTLTGTPTNTSTFTPTNTGANTATFTNTATGANTATYTLSPTPTTACPQAFTNSYPFNTNIGCWMTNNALGTTTVDWATGPAGSTSGGGAFHANVAYSAVSQATEEFEVPLPANTDLTNHTITMKIYIGNSVKGTAWGGGIQTYVKTTASTTFCSAAWVNIIGFDGWYTYTMDLSSTCTSNLNDVRAIGVQVIIATGGGAGNIYIDDVTVNPIPTPTPTLTYTDTPTPGGATPTFTPTLNCPEPVSSDYTFDGDLRCWKTNNALGTTTADWAAGPAGSPSGGGAFHANVAYSAVSQATEEFEVPLPPNTDLTNALITMHIYIDNSVKGTAWGGGIQPYIKTTASTTFCSAAWVNITGFGSWQTYTLDLSTTCPANQNDVRAIGVQVIIATGGAAGNIYLDDVTVASGTPANTPTFTLTPTDTYTPVPGATDTFTFTPTPTGAAATPTPCQGAFQTAYSFDTSMECWALDSVSAPVVTAWNIVSSPVTEGTGAMHIGFAEPATSANIQIEETYATAADLSGRTVTAWFYADPSMQGGGVQFFIQSGGWSWSNSTGVYLDATKVGKWVSVSWFIAGTDPTAVDQIGLQFYGIPASATGNVYVDNISFSAQATPTNTPVPGCTPTLLNNCETLTENGTWGGSNSLFSISTTGATLGSNALDVNIATPPAGGWNDQFIQLSGFTPNTWSNGTVLTMDMTVDASVLAGTGWNQMYLEGSTGGGAWTYMSSNHPALSTGLNHVTFNLDWTQGLVATDPLDMLVIVLQTGTTSGTGNVYLDNVQVNNCP